MSVKLSFGQQGLQGSGTATATPSTQTQAAGVVPAAQYTVMTVANAADATTLPRGTAGQILILKGGANASNVFPPVGGSINGGTVDAAVSMVATVKTVYLYLDNVNVIALQTAA